MVRISSTGAMIERSSSIRITRIAARISGMILNRSAVAVAFVSIWVAVVPPTSPSGSCWCTVSRTSCTVSLA